jgi:hypothetical protein
MRWLLSSLFSLPGATEYKGLNTFLLMMPDDVIILKDVNVMQPHLCMEAAQWMQTSQFPTEILSHSMSMYSIWLRENL